MTSDWRNWCRLCGNCESTLKIEYTSDIEQFIANFLTIPSIELKVCSNCLCALNEIQCLIVKSKSIQNMFQELLNCELDVDVNFLNETRAKFGLKELNFVTENDEESEFDKSFLKQEIRTNTTEFDLDDLPLTERDIQLDDSEMQEWEKTSKSIKQQEEEEPELTDQSEEDQEITDYEGNTDESFEQETKKSEKRKKSEKVEEKAEEDKLFEFVCHICNVEFIKMFSLVRHCKKEHKCLPQVQCICGKSIGSWAILETHKKRHFPKESTLQCKICGLFFVKQISLDAHHQKKHGPQAEKKVCSQCGRSFKTNQILKKHEETHLPDELRNKIPCTMCEQTFVNRTAMKKHMNSIHTKEQIFICQTCGKSFTSRQNLAVHGIYHKTERDFACSICDKRFKSRSTLRAHKKVHGEKNIECLVCGTKFRSNALLSLHMVVHSDEKKYKCTYCPNEYKRSDALKIHLNTHTGCKPFQCLFCDRAFNNGPNRRKHTLKDHPQELAIFEAQKAKNQEMQNQNQ